MDNDTRQILSNLVKDPLLEELELEIRQPNIFYILNIHDAEIRHSNLLAWLLDPQQNHKLGDLFLRHFLKDIFSNDAYEWMDEFSVDQLDLNDVEIRREWNNIDLLIVLGRFVVCIENKIHAQEHSSQLKRYRDVVGSAFPRHNHCYVYLTPQGKAPTDEDDISSYQTYSYSDVVETISTILRIYAQSVSDRIRKYLEDYIVVLRREIMKDDSVNELARRIYQSHREALDFIFDNKPDRLAEVDAIFEEHIKKAGWILGSRNKGYARFLTKESDPIIPRSGSYGWKNKESFLMEFDYWPKNINFKTVIPPGDDRHREILAGALSSIEGASKPRGNQWLVHFNRKWSFDVTNPNNSDDVIERKLKDIWPEISELVGRVEKALLKVQAELQAK